MWLLSAIAPYVFASGSQLFLQQAGMARDGYSFEWATAFGVLIFQNGFITETPSSNGPLWSLSFEVWLYVVYFLCFMGFKRRHLIFWFTAIGAYGFLLWFDQTKGDHLFLKYSFVWCAGVLLFHLLSRDERLHGKKSNLRVAASMSAAALTVYFGCGFVSSNMTDDITLFNIAFGLFFSLYLWTTPPKLPNVIKAIIKPAACFGYTLYLVHFPIYLFVFGIFQPYMRYSQIMSWFVGLTTLIFTLFLSFFSAKFLERRELFVGRVA
jgi:peptidoglycan/LPS O-acetylase OafA/YrhL